MSTSIRCRHCSAEFTSEGELERHLEREHPDDPIARMNARIDEASEASFPASDPPAATPVQGVGCPNNDR